MRETLLFDVPHDQIVLTITKMLRARAPATVTAGSCPSTKGTR
jgi:hypothetical protein